MVSDPKDGVDRIFAGFKCGISAPGDFPRILILRPLPLSSSEFDFLAVLNPRSRKSALGEIQESRLGERGSVCGCWSCYAELVGTMWAGFGREREGKMDCTSFRQGKMSSFLIMCMQHVCAHYIVYRVSCAVRSLS
ncbi:unnamed protein product [Musa hybrid cultivar]